MKRRKRKGCYGLFYMCGEMLSDAERGQKSVPYPVLFLMRSAVSLIEPGKPGILEKFEGIPPSFEKSGKHLPSTNGGENNHNKSK